MRYLLIIITLIILIILLHIYLNIDEKTIDNFSPLPMPFLGPIEFQDKESGEKLGEYPENWQTNSDFGTDSPENIEVTVVKINRGPQGDTGDAGTPSGVGICEGRIDIESIDTDKLEINVNEINMIADRLNITNNKEYVNSKICIGDNCLDAELINKIKYSNSLTSELDAAKNEIKNLKEEKASLNNEILKLNRDKAALESPDKSYISSININTPNNSLEISGNSLDFSGNTVKFENEFCVGNFCLTEEDMKKISQHPEGEPGNPGMCADAV